ncbi:hypothetical protein LCGC14_2342130 [marine sediment metagenome]|uniref:Uncharacterized protein n=1 Tax=marine sediment metagenome TaxID=412755 RepID=A0A0F9F6W0_9ZZZZ
MEEYRCKKCNRILRNEESIKRGYGAKCYRIITLQNQETKPEQSNNTIIEELLNRVRKLELDNNFMKHQLKHKTFVNISKDSELKWDIPEEVKEVRNQYKFEFNVVVKELKILFHENFDYHEILQPIGIRKQPEASPQLIENLIVTS